MESIFGECCSQNNQTVHALHWLSFVVEEIVQAYMDCPKYSEEDCYNPLEMSGLEQNSHKYIVHQCLKLLSISVHYVGIGGITLYIRFDFKLLPCGNWKKIIRSPQKVLRYSILGHFVNCNNVITYSSLPSGLKYCCWLHSHFACVFPHRFLTAVNSNCSKIS